MYNLIEVGGSKRQFPCQRNWQNRQNVLYFIDLIHELFHYGYPIHKPHHIHHQNPSDQRCQQAAQDLLRECVLGLDQKIAHLPMRLRKHFCPNYVVAIQ